MTFASKLKEGEVYLLNRDPKLAPVIKKYGPCRLKPHKNHYAELVSAIAGQQLSAKAGDTIWRRVLDIFDGDMPTPRQLIGVDTEVLRACGVSYGKAGYMKDLAEHIIDGRLDTGHLTTLSDQKLIDQLTAIKGIGEWTAHMFMIFSLGRLDILPTGDLGIKKATLNLYGLKQLPDPKELEKLAGQKRWSPYRSIASWYLWKSLDNT